MPAVVAAVLSVILDVLITKVLSMPPGFASPTAADQTVVGQVFAIIAGDVFFAVVAFAVSFMVYYSKESNQIEHDRHARSNTPLQVGWLVASIVLVLFAAGYGVVALEGQTTPSLAVPAKALAAGAATHPFIVQVIGQQWQFTYRYPQYGGFESQQLRVPVGRLVEFEVTSLDVTHSFWAYQLGVKIDANSGDNNVGYAYISKPTVIDVRCGELCGLWHGYMTNVGSQAGRALSASQFASWLSYAEATYGPETKYLPKFSLTYYPAPTTY
ncbi:MAG: hypothetical protein ACREN7_03975 [Candidatus Dormibacteria bacterium]